MEDGNSTKKPRADLQVEIELKAVDTGEIAVIKKIYGKHKETMEEFAM